MTDAAWLLSVLEDGGWHTLAEILRRSEAERGHGLTVHSRAADLRKQGHTIEQTSWRASNGRVQSSYRLVDTPHREGDADSSSPVSEGWVTAHDPEHARRAATALNVAPTDRTGDGGSAASPAMVHDGGGDPGNAPIADAPTLFDAPAAVQGAYGEAA